MSNRIFLLIPILSWVAAAIPLSAQSFAPANPVREHFYFAGRRVATDNFANCQAVLNLIQNFPYTGGQKTSALTAGSGCAWQFVAYTPSVIDNATSGPDNGFGSANVTVGVTAYGSSSLPRTGAVSFGGQHIRFTQGAQNPDPNYTFPDVANDSGGDFGQFNYAALVKYYKLTNGCGSGQFCPNDALTKAQIAAFLIRALLYGNQPTAGCTGDGGYPYSAPNNTCGFQYPASPYYTDFTDTANGLFPYVQKLRELNLAIDCSTGYYCPNDTVSRGMMAEFVIRTMVSKGKLPASYSYPQTAYFTDVPSWMLRFSSIQKLREQGITAGTSATEYSPNNSLKRIQMAVFLIRAFFTGA